MAGRTLYQEYFWKAGSRRKALAVLFADQNFADVIREGQELVELVLKGLLRKHGIDPPKWHDVSQILMSHEPLLPPLIKTALPRITSLSKALRKEREMSFYGDEDFIPSENYTEEQATFFLGEIDWLLALLRPELGS